MITAFAHDGSAPSVRHEYFRDTPFALRFSPPPIYTYPTVPGHPWKPTFSKVGNFFDRTSALGDKALQCPKAPGEVTTLTRPFSGALRARASLLAAMQQPAWLSETRLADPFRPPRSPLYYCLSPPSSVLLAWLPAVPLLP